MTNALSTLFTNVFMANVNYYELKFIVIYIKNNILEFLFIFR